MAGSRIATPTSISPSALSALVVLAMLIFIYRSALAVVLVVIPVAFGLLIGVLVVNAVFGSVHAITLGFAATLIGEAVDYPSYLLLNTAPGEAARNTARRLRVTFALAVLTTVVSALALTLSSFKGLAQLGVLTMVGVLVAGLITQFLIPWLLGERELAFPRLKVPSAEFLDRSRWPGVVAALAVAGAGVWLAYDLRYAPSGNAGWLFRFQDDPIVRQRLPSLTAIVGWIDGHRVLPNAFSQGFLLGQAKAQSREAFLAGHTARLAGGTTFRWHS